jgi:glycosyltransferase involved in cell wall biosynthesis
MPRSKFSLTQILIGLLIFIAVLWMYREFKAYFKIQTTSSYILPSDTEVKGEKGVFTWLIHAYVPDHNAGSEWMAHAMNTFLIREKGVKVNVVTNKSSVAGYERVRIIEKNNIKVASEAVADAQVLLSHHTMEPNAVKTAVQAKKPLVILLHDNSRKRQLRIYKYFLPKNLYIIANSKWLQNYYADLNLPGIVVYPPVDSHDYEVSTNREYITLINVNKNKGGEQFIKIAKGLPDYKFLGVKGAYNKQVVDLDQKNILYVNSTPQIKEIYSKTGILLMPSKEESWGRTAVEAMASGIPVIAHPTPGLLESCGSAGIFCDRDDTESWIREIRRLKTDSAYYKEKSDLCKRRALELNPEIQLENFAKWIDKIQWKE